MYVTEPATSAQTALDSVSPAAARARVAAFVDDADGSAILVSATNPLPTSGGGGSITGEVVVQFEDGSGNPTTVTAIERLPTYSLTAFDAGGVTAVSAANPLPTTVIGDVTVANGSLPLDINIAQQSSAVSVTGPIADSGGYSTFTSTVAAELLAANSQRRRALIFLPDTETADLHILWGATDVTGTKRSYTIKPGGSYYLQEFEAPLALWAILSAAGTARVTEFFL